MVWNAIVKTALRLLVPCPGEKLRMLTGGCRGWSPIDCVV